MPGRVPGIAPKPPSRKNIVTATEHSQEIINVAAQAAADKLAHNIIAFDVSDVLSITDAFLIASANNDRQVKSIAEEIEDKLREQLDIKPVRREGERDGRWILLDYLDIVVHVQHSEERSFYSLDRLWKDCPELPLPADALASRNRPDAHTDEAGNALAPAEVAPADNFGAEDYS